MREPFRHYGVVVTAFALTVVSSHPAKGQTAEAPAASPPSNAAPVEPESPQVVHRKRTDLLINGSLVFGLAWLPAAMISMVGGGGCDDQSCRTRMVLLAVPVLGPMQVGGEQSSEHKALFVLWGLIQAGGIAMIVAGLIGHDVPVETNQSTVAIIPTASPHAAGVLFRAFF